ncbi:hypothetical protein [Psychrobacillus psychrotolerans]|uniref:hypothetical protein n=1 Tax=Psychrobacillus psychrotolerans TaxID=126156 RepID=UPI0011137AA0|nr:hypothetical protein [Psychrobacillus psychrotolerans]
MSSIRDQVIIERIKRIKEGTDIYGGPTPFQDLRIVDKYKDVLDRNGLLEEFKGLFDEIESHGSMKSTFDKEYRASRGNGNYKGLTPPRATILSSESKASRPPRATILSSESKASRPPRATILSSESKASRPPRATILSSESKASRPPRATILSSESKASRPPRATILSSESKASRPPSTTILSSESKAISPPRVTILSADPSVRNTFTNYTTYVNSHIRRNKNGTISIVRGHTRRT